MGMGKGSTARRFYGRWARLLAVPVVALSMHAPVYAAPATAEAQARAIILDPLSFFRVQDLHMGDIVPSAAAGTVRLRPDGTRTATGGVTLAGTSHQPARFAGLGRQNQQVTITLAANSIQLTGPGAAMTLSDLEIGSTPTAILSTKKTDFTISQPGGNYNFPVGGTLAVNANQAPGSYTGQFTITLDYK